MSFGIKHLLIVVLYIGVGLTALINEQVPLSVQIVRLLTLGTLIVFAYGIWTSAGEGRAFRIGFLIWGGLYYLLYVVIRPSYVYDLGISEIMDWLARLIAPGQFNSAPLRLKAIGHPLFSLLFGLIGGWVTVYFYRKRQRMLSKGTAGPGE